jgi:DNA-binding response OmpR family regulator
VVIIDIKLPDASGFQLAERIRERYGMSNPLLVAISAVYNKGPDRILSNIVGFDHHLTKPVTFDALLHIIEPLTRPGFPESLRRRAMDNTQELVSRAAELVGREKLAQQLDVPQALLQQWIDGAAKMPDRKLFALAAILVKVAERK